MPEHYYKAVMCVCFTTLCRRTEWSLRCVFVLRPRAGKRGGVRGVFGGAVRRPHRRPESPEGPAAVPCQQGARTQAEGEEHRTGSVPLRDDVVRLRTKKEYKETAT